MTTPFLYAQVHDAIAAQRQKRRRLRISFSQAVGAITTPENRRFVLGLYRDVVLVEDTMGCSAAEPGIELFWTRTAEELAALDQLGFVIKLPTRPGDQYPRWRLSTSFGVALADAVVIIAKKEPPAHVEPAVVDHDPSLN